MTKNIYIIIGVILVVVVLIFLNLSTKTEAPASQDQSTTPTGESSLFGTSAPLLSEGDSDPKGGVDIVEVEGKIEVSIQIADIFAGPSMPAHLHSGSCDALGGILFQLNPVIDGSSQTTLNVSGDEFQSELPLVVNVHKSEAELNVNIACGSISGE